MSLTIIGIDKSGEEMHVITDKRTVKEIDHTFVSDDIYKITKIRKNLVYFGSSYSRVPDEIILCVPELVDLPASKIIDRINAWDRRFRTLEGVLKNLPVQLAGVYDDGRLFIASFQEDGTLDYKFAQKGFYNGTVISPCDKVTQLGLAYLPTVIKHGLIPAMEKTALYLSTIDNKISSTTDSYNLKINLN